MKCRKKRWRRGLERRVEIIVMVGGGDRSDERSGTMRVVMVVQIVV